MADEKINIKILDFAAFMKLLFMVDQGNKNEGGYISDAVMEGDFKLAWTRTRNNADFIFSKDGFSELMNVAVKYGVAKFVVNATPLKQSFSMFGIRIGF